MHLPSKCAWSACDPPEAGFKASAGDSYIAESLPRGVGASTSGTSHDLIFDTYKVYFLQPSLDKARAAVRFPRRLDERVLDSDDVPCVAAAICPETSVRP